MRLLALLLVLAAVAACRPAESAPTTPPTTLVVNEDTLQTYSGSGFEIAYPQSWTPREEEDGLVVFEPPASVPDRFNVAVIDVPDDFPPAAYYLGEVGRLSQFLDGVRVIEENEVQVGEGVVGRGVTAEGVASGVPVTVARLLVLHRGTVWEVTYITPTETFPSRAPLIRELMGSFRLDS
jgi:hypothetical protein